MKLKFSYQLLGLLLLIANHCFATNYTVSDKTTLQSRMTSALPGDTVIVLNGTYNNWGTISFSNTKGTNTSAWIVLKAQSFNGVVFSGTTNLLFAGRRILITGFRFANGSSGGATDVIQFRTTSTILAHYCRLNNVTIDNFNSDSTGGVQGIAPDVDNKWVSIYGTNNRVDHCTFINKFNAGATVVVWYDNNTYPNQSTTTLHRIDSNYFKGRGYLGANGGETIRVGTSTTSRSNGYNIVEYNLFEDCSQVEPEIVSNKSNFNTYRYNTFKNCTGGMTMRHGRYCSVYGNFFIVDNPAKTTSYGIRLIDKGHQVFNNYFEGLLGNRNSLTSLRCPIILYNGKSSTNDTTDAAKASGYFPADSCVVAFNTIANCSGGGGIVMGFTDAGGNTFQPLGIRVGNNLIKMTTGQAAYIDPLNTILTYSAEGNIFNAPNGLGLSSSLGFTNTALTFGSRLNGTLPPPSLVQDASINTANYTGLLNGLDAHSQVRSSVYDVGCDELNGSGNVINYPLDSNLVGAGKPLVLLPVHLLAFKALLVNKNVQLTWSVGSEINFKQYVVEVSNNAINFSQLEIVNAKGQNAYTYTHYTVQEGKYFYRIKLVDKDGSFTYSPIRMITVDKTLSIHLYPNPAKQFVTINFNGSIQPNTELVLVDVSGKQVLQQVVNANSINLSLKNIPSSMYVLQVKQDGTIKNHQPLIITQ